MARASRRRARPLSPGTCTVVPTRAAPSRVAAAVFLGGMGGVDGEADVAQGGHTAAPRWPRGRPRPGEGRDHARPRARRRPLAPAPERARPPPARSPSPRPRHLPRDASRGTSWTTCLTGRERRNMCGEGQGGKGRGAGAGERVAGGRAGRARGRCGAWWCTGRDGADGGPAEAAASLDAPAPTAGRRRAAARRRARGTPSTRHRLCGRPPGRRGGGGEAAEADGGRAADLQRVRAGARQGRGWHRRVPL